MSADPILRSTPITVLPVPEVVVWPGITVPARSFAGRVYVALQRAGWSITTLTQLTGIDPVRLIRLVDGAALPTADEVDAVSRWLDIYRDAAPVDQRGPDRR